MIKADSGTGGSLVCLGSYSQLSHINVRTTVEGKDGNDVLESLSFENISVPYTEENRLSLKTF